MNKLFVNKRVWRAMSEAEYEKYLQDVFEYYRNAGFPHFPTDMEFRTKEFHKLMNFRGDDILTEDGCLRQTMHGLSLAWSYMPHFWGVRCNGLLTCEEVFHDDEKLKAVIRKRTRMGDNMSDNGIRKTMKMFTGTQCVSNFRPTAAYGLYQGFCDEGDTVLDMSMGFGGRLLGAIKANVNYVGCDPSTKSYIGCTQIVEDFGRPDGKYQLIHDGSENLDKYLDKHSIDFAFTSPPYFDTEIYSDEPTQSCNKYSNPIDWLTGYLCDTFNNVHYALKPDGFMAINVANVKSMPYLERSVVKYAERCGFKLVDTMKLSLSNSNFSKGKSPYKYEPIFIFSKQEDV